MEPVSASIASGVAAGVAKEIGKEAARKWEKRNEPHAVCVEQKIPGTPHTVTVCARPKEACAITPHPKIGLPVETCVSAKVKRSDVKELAKGIAQQLADHFSK